MQLDHIDIYQLSRISGCKPCWALIEYAYNLHIPDEVMDHPTIRNLGEAANDLVTWSNVSSSFVFSHANLANTCCLPPGHLFLQRGTVEG